jgi:peptidylprolyl isomerase
VAVGLAAVAALLLGACSDDSGTASTDTSATEGTTTTVVNTDSLEKVEISADLAVAPTVTFAPSFGAAEPQNRVVAEGTGPAVEAGQRAVIDYTVFSGVDGSQLETTWGSRTEAIPIDDTLQQVFRDALVNRPAGSRVAVSAQSQGQWVILVFDIRSSFTLPTSASGEEVPPEPGLPTVAVQDGRPTVSVPSAETPPSTLVVQPLIEGEGPEVAPGQNLTVHTVAVKWGDGQTFFSSWEQARPVDFTVGAAGVIPGLDEGLVGQTVGSRVLLVIPPDRGYGSEGNPEAGISGTDTLVFVVDILAAS